MRTINIVTLGESGVGKTVYLTVLHHALCVEARRQRRPGLHSDVPRRQANRLDRLYDELRNGEWPQSTDKTMLYQTRFTIQARSVTDHYPMAQIGYIDYDGEHLTAEDEPGRPKVRGEDWLDERLHTANALLGFLDGEKVLSLMRREEEGRLYLRSGMRPMLRELETNETAGPVHLVITKWDLLQAAGVSLGLVREELMEDGEFAEAVRLRAQGTARQPGGIVRLIPVSAVGTEFVEVRDGGLRRREDAKLRPVNIAVPLYQAMADIVDHLRREQLRRSAPTRWRRPLRSLRKAVPPATRAIERAASEAFPGEGGKAGRAAAKAVTEGLAEWLLAEPDPAGPARGVRGRRRARRRDREAAIRWAVSEIDRTLQDYQDWLGRLDDDLLASAPGRETGWR